MRPLESTNGCKKSATMQIEAEKMARKTPSQSQAAPEKHASRRETFKGVRSTARRFRRIPSGLRWPYFLTLPLLAAVVIPISFAGSTPDRMLLPIEVLSVDGSAVSRSVALEPVQAASAQTLWLRIHGVRYADQASVQVNASGWMPLNNSTVT